MSQQIQMQAGQVAEARREGTPQRILILADCSGQAGGKDELSVRRIHSVDIDRFDALLARFAPRISVFLTDGEAPAIALDFERLEDFHPDALFSRLPVFGDLRTMRERLQNPATFEAAAEELKRGLTADLPPPVRQPDPAVAAAPARPPTTTKGDSTLFERLLGKAAREYEPSAPARRDDIDRLIASLVAPHLRKGPDLDQQRQLLSAIDDCAGSLMRRILHQPAFQALEATWHSVHWLVNHIENDEQIRVFLLDVSPAELMDDLRRAGGNCEGTAFYRRLKSSSTDLPGGEPWSLVLANQVFGAEVASLDLLENLGGASAACGGVFVASAHCQLLGCASLFATPDASDWREPGAQLATRWDELRRSPSARSIGLAIPRFLLRRPYGEKSEPLESFRFEEMPACPPHNAYLWGNPAFACAAVIADAWLEANGSRPGTLRLIDDLPCHIYDDGTGPIMKPCAEVYLNETTADSILGRGIVPLLSIRNRNSIAVPLLRSIAAVPTALR